MGNEIDKSPIFKFEFYGQNNILQNYNLIGKKISSKSNCQNKKPKTKKK